MGDGTTRRRGGRPTQRSYASAVADPDWWLPDQPWRVKIERADAHIADLKARIAEYQDRGPFEVRYEATDEDDWQRVRLVMTEPIPPVLSAVIGDVAHNLRSALDSVAYALARQDFDGEWTEQHEAAPAFPVRRNGQEFEKFFAPRRNMPEGTFSQRAQDALRFVQPFYWAEQYPGTSDPATLDDEFKFSTLRLIQHASNVDKHRRLLVAAWTPTIFYWGSDGGTARRMVGPRSGDDADVIAYQYDPPEGSTDTEVTWEIELVLRESGFPDDRALTDVVDGWRQSTWFAVQSIFSVWGNPAKP